MEIARIYENVMQPVGKLDTALNTRDGYEKVFGCVRGVFEFLKELPSSPALKDRLVVIWKVGADMENVVGVFSFAHDIVELCKGQWWAGQGNFDAGTFQNIFDRSLCFIQNASMCGLHGFKTVSLVVLKLSVGTAIMPIAAQVGAVAIPVFCVMLFARGAYQHFAYDENNADRPSLTKVAGMSLLAISASCGEVYARLLPAVKELGIAALAFGGAWTIADLGYHIWNTDAPNAAPQAQAPVVPLVPAPVVPLVPAPVVYAAPASVVQPVPAPVVHAAPVPVVPQAQAPAVLPKAPVAQVSPVSVV